MVDPTIRDTTPADLDAVAEIRNIGWRTAYRGILADDLLDALDDEAEADRWRTFWPDLVPKGQHFLVAEVDGTVKGFALFQRQGRGDDLEPGVGELMAIYVHPDQWTTGAGQRLLDAATAHLASQGCTAAILWTFEANSRARRFYERNGWAVDGTTDDDHYGADAVRYRIRLAGGGGTP